MNTDASADPLDLTLRDLLERLDPAAATRLEDNPDGPVDWLVRAAALYAKEQERWAAKPDARAYADRAAYKRRYSRARRKAARILQDTGERVSPASLMDDPDVVATGRAARG